MPDQVFPPFAFSAGNMYLLRYDWFIWLKPSDAIGWSNLAKLRSCSYICIIWGPVRTKPVLKTFFILLETIKLFPVTTEYEKSHFIVNSFYSGRRRALELVATLTRVRNSGSLFQLNNHDLLLPGI